MKRIVYILTGIVLSLSLFLSCGRGEAPTSRLLSDFCNAFGIDGYRIYSSEDTEGGDSDIPPGIFVSEIPMVREYSLLLHSKLGSVVELGVFLTDSAEDRLILDELCRERLSLLGKLAGKYETLIFTEGDYFIYGFLPDATRAESILRSLI